LEAGSASSKFKPRSFDGWALDSLIYYDGLSPGTLRRVMCGSRLRRQAVFLALSFIHHSRSDDIRDRLKPLANPEGWLSNRDAEVGPILTKVRVRDLITALSGPIEGLVGALNRVGDDPLPPLKYRQLVNLLRRPDLRKQAKVLRQLEAITPVILTVLHLLDEAFLRPEIVQRFQSVRQITDFNSAVRLIRRIVPQVKDEDLVSSLKAISEVRHGAATWMERWLNKAVFETVPLLHEDDELVVLRSAEAMIDAAARFSNCLKSKIPLVAVGRVAYVEYTQGPAIIELLSLSDDQWAVEQIYAPRNEDVSPGLLLKVLRKLEGTGILLPARLSHAQRNNGAARLLHIHDYDVAALEMLSIGLEELDTSDFEADDWLATVREAA
jgi:hypothetical protein